jgi:hypothetical protein
VSPSDKTRDEVSILDSMQTAAYFEKRRQRLTTDEHINDAREEADTSRRQRQLNLRRFADATIDEIERMILEHAGNAGISNPQEFLEYVEMMLANRVIERRLAP